MAEQKYEEPMARKESMTEATKPSANPASDRISRGKQTKAAAAAYQRECAADAAAKFSNKGGGKARGY